MQTHQPSIAVLIPCYNEEGAIGKTVHSFQHALPTATIYVYDNNSTDNTIEEARAAGALVFKEKRQGKGEVVRRMFADIEADIYVLTDGDETYDANAAPKLIATLCDENLDMVVGTRSFVDESFPSGHILGNKAFCTLINRVFSAKLNDVFSGYRVMSRRFVKTLPLMSLGFEIETELTVHTLQCRIAYQEVPTKYKPRPEGTESKLNTFSDGFKILRFIVFLIRDIKPLMFFTCLSLVFGALSLILGIPVISEFMATGLVPRFPTAILASVIGLIAFMCLFAGIILDNVSRGRLEMKQLRFLALNNNISPRAQPDYDQQSQSRSVG
ncbi:glycosyltransferase family 2 protein [Vibrio sp. CAU 1672]|uniref:glycosyltransferase family 2 protein n=1 Tax=Vibrio sp. CAU 1672 TaxID=3032594 RepID=UPI0023DA910A|nr:glycosyltransferase family 2 protein [Vibrio sp. CAU 1672]MDF2154548.1 glycosyltransferase family 2 protein [Vibrio sp. CAU 1672]